MSTVGYGDIYPVSVPGRMIMTLGGIMGGTLTAGLVTTVFVDLAILTENEYVNHLSVSCLRNSICILFFLLYPSINQFIPFQATRAARPRQPSLVHKNARLICVRDSKRMALPPRRIARLAHLCCEDGETVATAGRHGATVGESAVGQAAVARHATHEPGEGTGEALDD